MVNHLKILFFFSPSCQCPSNIVYSTEDSGPSKFVQVMILEGPSPFYSKVKFGPLCFHMGRWSPMSVYGKYIKIIFSRTKWLIRWLLSFVKKQRSNLLPYALIRLKAWTLYTMQNKFSNCFCMCQINHVRLSLSLYCIKIQAPITREEFPGKKMRNDQSLRLYKRDVSF